MLAANGAVGTESHGIRVEWQSCFEALNVPGPAPATTIPPQHTTLKAGCNAVDAGEVLPNMNDGFSGNGPDLGAYEIGRALPHYGPRTSGGVPPADIVPPLPPANLEVH